MAPNDKKGFSPSKDKEAVFVKDDSPGVKIEDEQISDNNGTLRIHEEKKGQKI